MAVGLGIEPSLPFQVVRISNPLHYHPAPRPYVLGSTGCQPSDLTATIIGSMQYHVLAPQDGFEPPTN